MKNPLDLVTGDTWPKRRKVIYLTLIFNALVVAVALAAAVVAGEMTVVLALAGYAFLLTGSVIGSYVFGSVWDDNDKRRVTRESPKE